MSILARQIFFVLIIAISSNGTWAGVIGADLFSAGDRLLLVDDSSGFEWLDLTQTVGFSINQARASNFVTELGFRVANVLEIHALYESAGLAPGLFDPYSLERQSVSCSGFILECLLDPSGVERAANALLGLGITTPPLGTSFFGNSGKFLALEHSGVGLGGASVSSFRLDRNYNVYYDPLAEGLNDDTTSGQFGSGVFLVRGEVPAPAPLLLIAMGLSLLAGARKIHRDHPNVESASFQ